MSMFYNFFKNLVGIPERRTSDENARQFPEDTRPPDKFRNPIWSLDDDDEDDDDFRHTPSPFGFRVFSDPIEIHRFFEHQMNEMLKSFQKFEAPGIFDPQDFPALPPAHSNPQTKPSTDKSLRDEFLKPGYQEPVNKSLVPGYSKARKSDSDLDDRITVADLDKILGGSPSLEEPAPARLIEPGVQRKVFGKSVISKTVRRPDGSVEHHRTVRDNEGNEETTVTRQIGDQTYSIITKSDASGMQNRVENFVNMDEDNLAEFEKKWNSNHAPNLLQPGSANHTKPYSWFPFDKFFH